VVQNAEEVCDLDPQLAHRGVFIEMDHPEIGPARFEGIPFIAERARSAHWRSVPLLGEDNRYVFTEVVGMDDAEFEHLTQEGVI
jgi:benzylsuccinate CoA-transferase BbsF subunit